MFLIGATLVGGVNAALAVVTLHQRGIANAALLFTAVAATTFCLRYPAGRMVDRFGPRLVAIPTAAFHLAGSALAATAHSDAIVVISGICSGCAWSAMVPVGIALLFERSSRSTRGAAMGAYNLAFAIGSVGGRFSRRSPRRYASATRRRSSSRGWGRRLRCRGCSRTDREECGRERSGRASID
ncbi:MFS transporter [Vulcanimicrobium alpinum]|uniref:MFS transporter n=1 Tax=Vulcanimicrobium alpinum TaxID=3016050 RepID=UPI00386BADA4